jgi:RNA polymerase sigma factor (sigma-70 family)
LSEPEPETAAAAVVTGTDGPEGHSPGTTDHVSIDTFLADIGARAFRFAELGLRQREDALDAVQDAMMRMLGYRERPSMEWTPLFWSILRRRVVDVQRRRNFRLRWLTFDHARSVDTHGGQQSMSVDWADEGQDPSRTHEGREAYARMAAALSALPRRQREAFSLRVLEELDVADTARAMACSEGSVKTHLSRAREALRRQLEEFQ